jgi:uracil-DNA glycosylase
MQVTIEDSWKKVLGDEFEAPYFKDLSKTVRGAYLTRGPVYPPPKAVFRAFELCPFDQVKVVILGQDPYHGAGQAHGLSFSVEDGVRIPPSLQNIYKEIKDDLGLPIPETGDLTHWAKQGVLLLNATLTVEAGKPGSHQGIGWETFTDAVVKKLSEERRNLVFMLWGKYAEAKGAHVDESKHLILRAPHPSPFSAHSGFFGCKHFSKANAYLTTHGEKPIEW